MRTEVVTVPNFPLEGIPADFKRTRADEIIGNPDLPRSRSDSAALRVEIMYQYISVVDLIDLSSPFFPHRAPRPCNGIAYEVGLEFGHICQQCRILTHLSTNQSLNRDPLLNITH